MDADDDQDFDAKLSAVKEKWDQIEGCFLLKNVQPSFHDFIEEKVTIFSPIKLESFILH